MAEKFSPVRLRVRDIMKNSQGTTYTLPGGKESAPHIPVMLNEREATVMAGMKNEIAKNKNRHGFVDRMMKKGRNVENYIERGTEPRMVAAAVEGDRAAQAAAAGIGGSSERATGAFSGIRNAASDFGDWASSAFGGGNSAASQAAEHERVRNMGLSAGSGISGGGGQRGPDRAAGIQREFDAYKAGEEGRNKAAAEKGIKDYRGEKRQTLTDEFGDYKDRYKSLEDQYDLGEERGAMKTLGTEAKQLGQEYKTGMSGVQGDIGGYESDVAGLRSGVAGLRQEQAGIGTKIGGLAEQALDPTSSDAYAKNRAMLSGTAEAQRKAQSAGAQEQLMRGMAGAGSSPEQIAMAKAKLAQGQGQQARQDALSTAMGAQQMTGQQLAQGAGLYGQQAGLGMQQANLYGQQAGMGLQAAGLAGQRAGLMGQTAQFGSGLIGQRAGLQGQSANLLQQQLQGKAGMMSGQVDMTGAQLQDVVAQENQAFEKDMAEKGFEMQNQAAAANRPRSPSSMEQLGGLVQTVAPIAMMAMSDRGLKKNVRSAKDKDLLSSVEIDGFLGTLSPKQYNYKDKNHGEGKQVGIMAQDLEKTQLGKQMVENTPEGKQVNFGKGLGLVMTSQARLNERLNKVGV